MVPGLRDRRLLFSLGGLLAGTILTWTLVALAYPHAAAPPGLDLPGRRLGFAAGLLVWPAGLTGVMVLSVALARLVTGAFDPLGDPESRVQRLNQRVLSNTVEQMAVFVPALLALASQLDERTARVLPVMMTVFCLSRLIFWAGYLINPLHRATGMIMTLNVNFGMIGYVIYRLNQ